MWKIYNDLYKFITVIVSYYKKFRDYSRTIYFRLVDAFTGLIKFTLEEHQNAQKIPLMASFTPESSHIMVGSSDGYIYFYDVETGEIALKTLAPNNQTCHIAEFSPQHFVAATADTKLVS